MIVSHRHRFIFFAVPKTATQSVRAALSRHLDEDDWQQQALFGCETLPVPELARIGHGHVSARAAKRHLPAAAWRDYFRFAFVRNPYDRFVSTCHFLFRDDPRFAGEATGFMKSALSRQRFRRRILVAPQSSLLADRDGELAVHFAGRFEALQRDYDEICQRLELPSEALERRNPSRHAHYSSYYDAELEEMVRDFYRDDFRMFGYPAAPEPVTN